MSKSKRNTVDPDDIITDYGADVARWFMLSRLAARPRRRMDRARRAGRLAFRAAAVAAGRRSGRDGEIGAGRTAGASSARGPSAAQGDPLRLGKVTDDIEKLHFNVCVAAIYEFANALSGAIGDIGSDEGSRTWVLTTGRAPPPPRTYAGR